MYVHLKTVTDARKNTVESNYHLPDDSQENICLFRIKLQGFEAEDKARLIKKYVKDGTDGSTKDVNGALAMMRDKVELADQWYLSVSVGIISETLTRELWMTDSTSTAV